MDEAVEATATVLVDVTLLGDPEDWGTGPLILTYAGSNGRSIATDAKTRSTYFHPRAAATLYGDGPTTSRWHRSAPPGATFGGSPVLALELIRIPTFVAPARGYLVVHVDLGTDPVATLAHLRFPSAEAVEQLSEGCAASTPAASRAVTISYVRFPDGVPAGPFGAGYEAWEASEQWLRVLASATPPAAFEPDPELDRQPMVALSRSWRCLPLRDGVAFLALRPVDNDAFLSSPAPTTFVRTIYTDAVVLGLMQRLTLHDIAERLVQRSEAAHPSERLREIEVLLDTFRTTLWWQNVTQHGIANDLLIAFQRQHALPQLLDQVISDLSDSARLHGLIEGERTANSLNAITAIGLPAGAVLAATPIWIDYGVLPAVIALLVAATLAATSVLTLGHLSRHRSR